MIKRRVRAVSEMPKFMATPEDVSGGLLAFCPTSHTACRKQQEVGELLSK